MRTDNIAMLEDTLSILDCGSYEKNGKTISLKLSKDQQRHAVVLLPDEVERICEAPVEKKERKASRTGHVVERTDTFSEAIVMANRFEGARILVLNFASAVHPGGGVRNGARAQEEDLCRKSSLLLSLETDDAKRYYDYNYSIHSFLGTNAMILTPEVEIIKDEKGELLDESVVVAVLTCAAPNISHGLEDLSEAEYEKLFYERIVATLKVAAYYGYDHLLLGAWGCGAFGNDAKMVANLYRKALKEFDYGGEPHETWFRHIHFAVLANKFNTYNYDSFFEVLDSHRFYEMENEAEIQSILNCEKERELCKDRIYGSLFGGAMGDALGYPVEFMGEAEIQAKFGPKGITSYQLNASTGKALISDDTQMSLFTGTGYLSGITRANLQGIMADPHEYVAAAYKDWLWTQKISIEQSEELKKKGYMFASWLGNVPELYSRRAPGMTCISAIEARMGSLEKRINDSKGCGGVMRVAPFALAARSASVDMIDLESAQIAALTHSHPLGFMTASVLNHIIFQIIKGSEKSLKEIVLEARDAVCAMFVDEEYVDELFSIITMAVALSENDDADIDNIHKLGEGWVAEETLAIAIYCSLRYQDDFSKAIIVAVNHNGDSDSTGAVTGNILGAWLGFSAIEEKWKKNLELYDVIEELADDLFMCGEMTEIEFKDAAWADKYLLAKWE